MTPSDRVERWGKEAAGGVKSALISCAWWEEHMGLGAGRGFESSLCQEHAETAS